MMAENKATSNVPNRSKKEPSLSLSRPCCGYGSRRQSTKQLRVIFLRKKGKSLNEHRSAIFPTSVHLKRTWRLDFECHNFSWSSLFPSAAILFAPKSRNKHHPLAHRNGNGKPEGTWAASRLSRNSKCFDRWVYGLSLSTSTVCIPWCKFAWWHLSEFSCGSEWFYSWFSAVYFVCEIQQRCVRSHYPIKPMQPLQCKQALGTTQYLQNANLNNNINK